MKPYSPLWPSARSGVATPADSSITRLVSHDGFVWRSTALLFSWLLTGSGLFASEASFAYHLIDKDLPQNEQLQGDYGVTALVDIDRDGDLNFVLGGRQPKPARLYWY